MLILNLAISDFLMGVYLIMLGIAGSVFEGTFGVHNLTWRSSSTCQFMGVLVVLSSETSVQTLALMAFVRLFSVCRVKYTNLCYLLIYLSKCLPYLDQKTSKEFFGSRVKLRPTQIQMYPVK